MAMPELIWEIFYRAVLLMGLLYAVDYALDGKLDLPHRKMKWEELKIAKWATKLWRKPKESTSKKQRFSQYIVYDQATNTFLWNPVEKSTRLPFLSELHYKKEE